MTSNKVEVMRKFGVQVEEVEPRVYKVLNPEIEVSVDKLQWSI